jgi:hypothetical protein
MRESSPSSPNREVLALPAGRELDALIAEHIFGWRWWRLAGSGRRCLYAPGEQPAHAMSLAEGHEPLSDDMEWQWGTLEKWSTDSVAATALAEKLSIVLVPPATGSEKGATGWRAMLHRHSTDEAPLVVEAETAVLAICRVALLAATQP